MADVNVLSSGVCAPPLRSSFSPPVKACAHHLWQHVHTECRGSYVLSQGHTQSAGGTRQALKGGCRQVSHGVHGRAAQWNL